MTDWRWRGPEEDRKHELVAMALDTKRVIDRIRSECLDAQRWIIEEKTLPPEYVSDFLDEVFKPQFLGIMDRLQELQRRPNNGHLFQAADELLHAVTVKDLPSSFVDEGGFQELYRCTWRATGHLVLAAGAPLGHAPVEERPYLAAAAACVMLDPTAVRSWEPSAFNVKGAVKILDQVSRGREREARDR